MSGIRIPTKLEYLVDWLKDLGPRTKGAALRAAGEAVGEVAHAQYSRGEGPRGQAWPPRKADGALALQRPAAAVSFEGRRGAIRAEAEDVLVHHRRRRPVFPAQNTLPAAWVEAAEKAIEDVLEKGAPK